MCDSETNVAQYGNTVFVIFMDKNKTQTGKHLKPGQVCRGFSHQQTRGTNHSRQQGHRGHIEVTIDLILEACIVGVIRVGLTSRCA